MTQLRGASLRWSLFGALAGTLLAIAGARALRSVTHEIIPADLTAYVAAALVIGRVRIAAAWLSALRAGTVDPAVTLREQYEN